MKHFGHRLRSCGAIFVPWQESLLTDFAASDSILTDMLSVTESGGQLAMKFHRITDGELFILQVLWERGEATSREIRLPFTRR